MLSGCRQAGLAGTSEIGFLGGVPALGEGVQPRALVLLSQAASFRFAGQDQ